MDTFNGLDRTDYCPECDGTGEILCPHCHVTEEPCDVCDGTGWNPERIDTAAMAKANAEFQALHGITCVWIEHGRAMGRQSLDGQYRLSFEPFIRSGISVK